MIKNLTNYLFRQNAHTYAVLDGASVPDLPMKLHESDLPNICLYRGELPADLVHVAPYLVHLLPETEFTNWLLTECWGRHWGIFVQSAQTITGMRKHFRTMLTVYDESGNPLLFRYYDPRVFIKFLPTCTTSELESFFGDVRYYFVETGDAMNLIRYDFSDNNLKKVNLSLESKNGN